MGELGFCNYHDILKAMSTQLLTDITTDGGWPIFLVRLLHNKIYYGAFYSLRCYLLYVDTMQLSLFISPVLYPFMLYALIGKKWRMRIWTAVLLMPILFIVFSWKIGLGEKIMVFKIVYSFVAFIGWIKLVNRFINKKKRNN